MHTHTWGRARECARALSRVWACEYHLPKTAEPLYRICGRERARQRGCQQQRALLDRCLLEYTSQYACRQRAHTGRLSGLCTRACAAITQGQRHRGGQAALRNIVASHGEAVEARAAFCRPLEDVLWQARAGRCMWLWCVDLFSILRRSLPGLHAARSQQGMDACNSACTCMARGRREAHASTRATGGLSGRGASWASAHPPWCDGRDCGRRSVRRVGPCHSTVSVSHASLMAGRLGGGAALLANSAVGAVGQLSRRLARAGRSRAVCKRRSGVPGRQHGASARDAETASGVLLLCRPARVMAEPPRLCGVARQRGRMRFNAVCI